MEQTTETERVVVELKKKFGKVPKLPDRNPTTDSSTMDSSSSSSLSSLLSLTNTPLIHPPTTTNENDHNIRRDSIGNGHMLTYVDDSNGSYPESARGSILLTEGQERVKMLIIGDSGVGKTSFIRVINKSTFEDKHIPTIGVDYTVVEKMFKSQGNEKDPIPYKINIWDTSGDPRYQTISHSYYAMVHAIIIMIDYSTLNTLTNLKTWIRDIQISCSNEDIDVLVCANKSSDLETLPTFTKDQILNQLRELEASPIIKTIHFFDVNAKFNSATIHEAFEHMTILIEQSLFRNPEKRKRQQHMKKTSKYLVKSLQSTEKRKKCSIV